MKKRQKKMLAPIGVAIKKKLVELNMTKRELADRIGANEDYITFILYGERSGAKYMDKIAEVLKLDMERYKKSA